MLFSLQCKDVYNYLPLSGEFTGTPRERCITFAADAITMTSLPEVTSVPESEDVTLVSIRPSE